MAQSQLALYNMALAASGANYTIGAVDEQSIPAELCQLWYENVRQTVLRAAHWNSAKQQIRLEKRSAADAETGYTSDSAEAWADTDPEPGYLFSYEIPCKILAARYLSDFSQFSLGNETATGGRIISCNVGGEAATDRPILVYTADNVKVNTWEPDLYQTVVYGLAAHISMGLHGKPSRAASLFDLANQLMNEARANTANEMHRLIVQQPASLTVRGYNFGPVTPFVYPYGAMFTGTAVALT